MMDVMSDPRFRPATAADLPAIVALLAEDDLGRSREDPGPPLPAEYLAAFQAISEDPNQVLAVAERGGVVVGCLQISFIPGLSRKGLWRGQIESVRVAAGERGAGLGRQMMLWAIECSRQRGCRLVQLTSDADRKDAGRFYASLGFIASHVGFKLALA
jgi:ribosomal protein S18 acetylase RimI-like enzyme